MLPSCLRAVSAVGVAFAQRCSIPAEDAGDALGFVEQCGTGFHAGLQVRDLFIKNNTVENSANLGGFVTVTGIQSTVHIMANAINDDRDHPVPFLATCKGGDRVLTLGNTYNQGSLRTVHCVANQYAPSKELRLSSTEAYVNGDGGATPISTLSASVDTGDTVEIVA